ncbi:MAG TPA: hypothetical protein VGK17_20020 [Propionicimonas sp.]|jgi:hypothetical protein
MSSSAVRTTPRARGLLVELAFSAVLVLIAEVVVRLAHQDRLPVLVVVLLVGNVLRGVATFWWRRRARPAREVAVEDGAARG